MRDLHRFCILSFTFLLIFSSLYLAKNIKEVSNGEYKYTLPGREIYQAIGKSQRKTNIKKLIIGDSTGNQFFNVFVDEDSIYSLACNQVIGMCGHYFLLDDFLKNGNRPEHVYMIFNVFSFSNNLDQNYTFHYFLKPFYKKEYRDRMSRTVIKQIQEIPYYYLSQFPTVIKSIWVPYYEPQHQFQLMSPISNEYLLKIDSLQSVYGFDLYLIPSLIPKSKREELENNISFNIDEVDIRLRHTFQKFVSHITYVEDSCFGDGTHLKYPQLYRDVIEKKMKGDSCRFNTQ